MMNVNLTGIRACVFDAYGTLFDVNSAAQRTQDALRDKWQQFAEVWRAKQLQYTWLRSLTGKHVDFWQLTSEALDFALDTLKLPNGQLRDHLMGLYLRLGAYPEVEKTLTRLKAGGLKCAILSNGSPTMLSASYESAKRNTSLTPGNIKILARSCRAVRSGIHLPVAMPKESPGGHTQPAPGLCQTVTGEIKIRISS
jgi:HAD superfamily hydrolase (TIGR01493 family)